MTGRKVYLVVLFLGFWKWLVYLNRYIKGLIRERCISDWVALSYICIFHSYIQTICTTMYSKQKHNPQEVTVWNSKWWYHAYYPSSLLRRWIELGISVRISVLWEGGYAELSTAGVHDSTHVNSLTTSPKDLFTWDSSTVLNNSEYFAVRELESVWQIEAVRDSS